MNNNSISPILSCIDNIKCDLKKITILKINQNSIKPIFSILFEEEPSVFRWKQKKKSFSSLISSNIPYVYLLGYELSQEEKLIILSKIYRYIKIYPELILYVNKFIHNTTNEYFNFILTCATKNIDIYKYINMIGENYILQSLEKNKIDSSNYLIFFGKYENFSPTLVEKLINYFKHDINCLRTILQIVSNRIDRETRQHEEELNRYSYNDEYRWDNWVSPLYQFLVTYKVINQLLSIDAYTFSNFYSQTLEFSISSFDDIYDLFTKYKEPSIIRLYEWFHDECDPDYEYDYADNNIEIEEEELLKLVKINSNILEFFVYEHLCTKFGDIFISKCIEINESSLIYYQNRGIVFDYDQCLELLKINTGIVEFIHDEDTFVDVFIYALKNIDKDYNRFITYETFSSHPLLYLIHLYFYSSDKMPWIIILNNLLPERVIRSLSTKRLQQ